ncbi:hypothetical protein Bca4012_000306 [Brassica carinata]|uniref:RRM domain-containing protein n=2 Tax=Brassica TaxID=3705 RepID=A0A0D3B014_BRAOL|nr:PREDICTED: nucleolin 1-like isoform X3 [Brassica oleracea var. oleracea]CAF1696555.1 unnamed protein product [Brassica napus]
MERSEPSSRMIDFLNASMERSESSSRVSAPYTGKRTLYGDKYVEVMKQYYDYVKSRIRIGVEGYDTSLEPIDLYRALESLFKTCGEVHNIEIRRDRVTKALQKSCIVILRGEGAGDKALQLNGSDIGGRKIVVTSLPPGLDLSTGLSTDVLAARSVAHDKRKRSEGISVTGYDTSLTKDDVKNALTNHFSTCGEITDVFVLNSRALVYFYEQGSNNRALQLSAGTDLGGCTLMVKALPYPKPKGSAWTRLRYRFRSATLSTITGWAHQM